jgi:hypothetical protein
MLYGHEHCCLDIVPTVNHFYTKVNYPSTHMDRILTEELGV